MLIPAVWLVDTTIMAPALGPIHAANPGASSFWINVVFTIPFLTSIAFSALSGRLARRIDKKTLTVLGLTIYGLAGILEVATGSLTVIFFLRLVTGVGLGLALPMPSVYITENYRDEKRERMLGRANAVAQVANIVVLVVAGALLDSGWRHVFWAYGLILVIAVVSARWLPSSSPRADVGVAATSAPARRRSPRTAGLPRARIAGVALAMMLLYVTFAFAAANISEFLTESGVAPIGSIGLIATAPAVGNIVGSLVSGRLRATLRSRLALAAVLVMGIGMLVFAGAGRWLDVVLAAGLVGLGTGLLTPYLLNRVTEGVPTTQRGAALGIVSAGMSLGLLVFPYVQKLIGLLSHDDGLPHLFGVTALVAFLVAAASSCARWPGRCVARRLPRGDRPSAPASVTEPPSAAVRRR
jgi:MFS family permease